MSINFLTVEEFAKCVKMHPGSIRRAIREGKIYATRPSMGVKAPFRIAESELERLQLKGMCENPKNKKGD
jgi:excisionase family DNA binding protein